MYWVLFIDGSASCMSRCRCFTGFARPNVGDSNHYCSAIVHVTFIGSQPKPAQPAPLHHAGPLTTIVASIMTRLTRYCSCHIRDPRGTFFLAHSVSIHYVVLCYSLLPSQIIFIVTVLSLSCPQA